MPFKKNILYILIAFIVGNVLIIFIQYNSTKNVSGLIDGNEKLLNEIKVKNDFKELQKDINYLDEQIQYSNDNNEIADTKLIENKISEIEKGLQSLQQISDDDISVKYIDILDTLIRKKLILTRQKTYASKGIERVKESILQEKMLNDSIANTTQIIESSREKILANISTTINKNGKRAINFSIVLIALVLISGSILFWYIVNIIQKQHYLIINLNASQKKLKEASQIKENFLANMSHEIRTPMNAILGFSNLLSNVPMNEDGKEYVKAINTSGENLLNIVNDILDLSKIEAGMMRIESTIFNLPSLISSIEEMMKNKAKEKDIELAIMLEENLPTYIVGDTLRLTQILINLLGNAIKFTNKGSVTLLINPKAIEKNSVTICFKISDTGLGIQQKDLGHIFERFNQAENDITRKYGGTGLGLAIVKDLVNLQHGSITVESIPEKGTTFLVTIPYTIVENNKAIVENNAAPNAPNYFENKTILIVEDNELNQNLLKHLLQQKNFRFDIANNGQEAIEKLQVQKFDLVLMDMQMPIMDGYTATTQIRNSLKLNIPIIAMTAHAFAGEREKCIGFGMNDYVAKPIREKELFNIISTFLPNEKLKEKTGATASINKEGYKYIDLAYMKEISNNDISYEKLVTNQFIETLPKQLLQLENAFNQKHITEFRQHAHNLKTTVSIMGLDKILFPYLDFFENIANVESISENKVIEFSNICNASKQDAIRFLSTM